MQLKWLAIPIISASAVLSYAPAASAMSLIPMEEPVTSLVGPLGTNPTIYPFTYSAPVAGTLIATPVTQNPLVCADTSAPLAAGYTLNPVYYSPTGSVGATPLPFVFGATAAQPTVSAMATGATSVSPNSNGAMQFSGDALGSLVCYGLNANGTRRLTPDIFVDGLETSYNSSVVLSVIHVPTSPTDYYEYTIDVTLPPLPTNTPCGPGGLDCNFVLLEGFDSSLLATSSANATSGIGGQWCMAPAGTNSCAFPPPAGGTSGTGGNLNINYTNYGTGGLPTLTAPVAPAAAKTYHFVAFRYLKTGVNALPSNVPVVIAALFSPTDLEENKLDDNVAAGGNQIANSAPAVVTTDDAWTTFSSGLASLVENTDSNTLAFSATDPDTQGAIAASVTLNLPGGISLAAQANCVPTAPPADQQAAANCTLAIPLSNATWWDASVGSAYDGLFNAVATDATNGIYAPGVSASARVVVSDALGKPSAPVTVPIHIYSSTNNKPVASYGNQFVMATDPQSNHVYPTMSCSVSLGSGPGGCGAVDRFGSIEVDVLASITALPGPPAAFDELATQGTAVVAYSDPLDTFTNVQCNRQQQAKIFATNGGPIVSASSAATLYDMNFVISGTPPASTVGAICTLTVTDVGPFPNGQSAMTSTSQFRLVVNP